MEFYMVWNASTTNDFFNVARRLKLKILASNLFLWREWLSFIPAFGTFATPRLHHSPFLPNSIEKMTQSYLQGSGRWKLHNGSCHLPKNWKDLSYSNILVKNHTSNFFGSQETSRKGILLLVNETKRPIHLRITPPSPLPLGVWCMERACGHHQVVFLLFTLEEKLSFSADTNAPSLALEFLLCTFFHILNVCHYLQQWNKVLPNYQSQNCRVIKSHSWPFQGKNVLTQKTILIEKDNLSLCYKA